MLTMRPFEQDGSWAAKSKKEYISDENGERIRLKSREFKTRKINTVDWNEHYKAEEWRAAWAESVNFLLERTGTSEKLDHRSYERQGIEQIPTIHMGVATTRMERRGIITDRGNINREIEVTNKRLQQLKARINKLEKWLKNEEENTEPPTLVDVIQNILYNGDSKTQWQKIHDLKLAAKILSFLQQNEIMDMADLQKTVGDMYSKVQTAREKLKPAERRLGVLKEHLYQYDFYVKHKSFYDHYKQLKPKKQPQYY